jgi:hypothetical protein
VPAQDPAQRTGSLETAGETERAGVESGG